MNPLIWAFLCGVASVLTIAVSAWLAWRRYGSREEQEFDALERHVQAMRALERIAHATERQAAASEVQARVLVGSATKGRN